MAGQANVYDLTRADEPTQEGTPINKASLLTDAVAAAFGLGTSAVPNDVLNILKKGVLAQMTGKYTKHTTIGELPLGKTVSFNFNGAATAFQVLHKGRPSDIYDVSCDGVWMEFVDILENRAWNSPISNDYKNSTIHAYLNGGFLNLLDANVRSSIKQVKIPYVNGTGSAGSVASGANGLSCKAFLLSGYEVGWTTSDLSYIPVDGAKLDYFAASGAGDDKRIAKLNGSASIWWLRSAFTADDARVLRTRENGGLDNNHSEMSYGLRPAFILPSDFEYTFYTDDVGNVYTEQEYTAILTDVLGNEITAGGQVEVGSYVGTGTYGESNPNTLTFGFSPAAVFIINDFDTSYFCAFILGCQYGAGFSVTYFNTGLSQTVTWDGKSMSWYLRGAYTSSGTFAPSATYQLNISGRTYHYVAIG